jgi:uncharacterized protein YceK
MTRTRTLFLLITLITAVTLLYGCATIMHGTSQKIGISSTPSGAKVYVDNNAVGVTPVFSNLKRGDEHIVKIELDGYQTAELTITKGVGQHRIRRPHRPRRRRDHWWAL